MVACLLDRGVDIDEVPDNPHIDAYDRAQGLKSALGVAAAYGRVQMVRLLLERGANEEIRDTLGRTALEIAEMRGTIACKECATVLKGSA